MEPKKQAEAKQHYTRKLEGIMLPYFIQKTKDLLKNWKKIKKQSYVGQDKPATLQSKLCAYTSLFDHAIINTKGLKQKNKLLPSEATTNLETVNTNIGTDCLSRVNNIWLYLNKNAINAQYEKYAATDASADDGFDKDWERRELENMLINSVSEPAYDLITDATQEKFYKFVEKFNDQLLAEMKLENERRDKESEELIRSVKANLAHVKKITNS